MNAFLRPTTLAVLTALLAAAPCGAAVIPTLATSIVAGNPCVAGEFSVAVSLRDNAGAAVGTYALTIGWDPAFSFVSTADGAEGFGVPPTVGGSGNSRNLSAFNAISTLVNGKLFILTLSSPGGVGPIPNVIPVLDNYGPTPLSGVDFMPIAHGFDTSATAEPCGAVPTDTPAPPTATPTEPEPTSTPVDDSAHLYAEVVDGDPCEEGTITVGFYIDSNNWGAVGTYAFSICWNPDLTYVANSAADCGFGVPPTVALPVGNCVNLSAFNAVSTLSNGCIFTIRLESPGYPCGPVDVIASIADFGATPLTTVGFQPIPHVFDNDIDDVDCGPCERWLWGDMNADAVAGAVDASLILQWDAFIIDEFPGYPGVVRPDYPPAGNVSDDDELGAVDASFILRYDALIIDCFPADYDCDDYGPEN